MKQSLANKAYRKIILFDIVESFQTFGYTGERTKPLPLAILM
jgi:hypothetical protein